MTLATQINQIAVPQEFTRLCNALLIAEHGDDFLPIDDDAPDGGNDGYLKSQRRLFAMHCFKRIQNQRIHAEISRKAVGDLGKAIALKAEGIWEIDAWTFTTNYPIPNEIGERLKALGDPNGIDVSWRGPDHLAALLLRHRNILDQFPSLEIADLSKAVDRLGDEIKALGPDRSPFHGIPSTLAEEERLIASQPDFWEYQLFAGILTRRLKESEPRWHDFKLGLPPVSARRIADIGKASSYLGPRFADIGGCIGSLDRLLTSEAQAAAFGKPGEPGDHLAIRHRADRIADAYDSLLDWANEIRGASVPEECSRLFELASTYASAPATRIRDFVTRLHRQIEQLPDLLASRENHDSAEPLVVEIILDFELPPGIGKEIRRETKRLTRRARWRNFVDGL